MVDNRIQPELPATESDNGVVEHCFRGEISRVVFCSDEDGYTVLRMIDQNGREQTVVGRIPGAYEGQGIEVSGTVESHREHGRQIKAKSFRFILPSTPDGIQRYLASGLIPGIGPKLAELIVDQFGSRTLEILDQYSSRLTEIPGFGKKRLEMVRKAWLEHAAKRDIFIFLQSLGISMAYCQRIYKRYGENAPKIIRANPYQLAEDVDGIGFILSDRIAENLGIAKDADERLAAGVLFAMNRLQEAGHVCYPENDLLTYAAELLKVDETAAKRGLEVAITRRMVVREKFPGEGIAASPKIMIYSASLAVAERELVNCIRRLSQVSQHRGQILAQVPLSDETKFNEQQQEALAAVARSPLSIITGGPGVGKTTVVGELVRRARIAGLKVYLAAPTGRAAKRLGESCRRKAMTIHRMLKWDPASRSFVFNANRQMRCDLLVLDEVSMLDINLALQLFQAVRSGTTVVMVGDADQLPSVGPGTVLMDLIKSARATVSHLSRIYRQEAHSRIISNAHTVNRGLMPDTETVPGGALSDFYWIDEEDAERAAAVVAELVCNRIPRRFGFDARRDIQVLTPMNRGACGTRDLNQKLQQRINPEGGSRPHFQFGERVFRSGDRVMQIRNNYDKGVFNGDMGRIIHIDYGEKAFRVAYDIGNIEYEFIEADQIRLAYAITVHKSQGSEFPAVVFPLLTQHYLLLQRNLIYTGMTRARQLLVMLGSRRALAMAVKNTRLEPRFSMLLERLTNNLNQKE